jgi:hypothetical protein
MWKKPWHNLRHKPGIILEALSRTTETSVYKAAAEIGNVHPMNANAGEICVSQTLI